jgi:hypothetical protein
MSVNQAGVNGSPRRVDHSVRLVGGSDVFVLAYSRNFVITDRDSAISEHSAPSIHGEHMSVTNQQVDVPA